jgi:hypothetical protein
MSKITGAKIVDKEEKGTQQIEKELIEKKEIEDNGGNPLEDTPPVIDKVSPPVESPDAVEMNEESVLSFMNTKYGKDTTSLDDYTKPQVIEKEREWEYEDVKAFHDYKKETGRSLNDFIEINRDYSKMSPDETLRNYYGSKHKGLDSKDIQDKISMQFGFDRDVDEEDSIRRKEIAKKEEVARATEYFEKNKEQFNVPLESSAPLVSEAEKEDYEAYKQHKNTVNSQEEIAEKQRNFFSEKTNELFSDKFEGFKFKVGEDKEVVYNPSDVGKIKESNSQFYINQIDEKGFVKDIEEYQKAITIAGDPEKFAKYFYEQGQASAVDKVTQEAKNIDMGIRQSSSAVKVKQGMTARIMGQDNGKKLRIRK